MNVVPGCNQVFIYFQVSLKLVRIHLAAFQLLCKQETLYWQNVALLASKEQRALNFASYLKIALWCWLFYRLQGN